MIIRKKMSVVFAVCFSILFFTVYCTHDNQVDEVVMKELTDQVRVQVAYDASHVAFKFVWKSQNKKAPSGQANVGFKYPGQFHDILKHNGTSFDRLPSGQRLEEDRVSFMINRQEGGIQNFAKAGCAISCHQGMASHFLETNDILDHWHWRGGRSGPMGYAEDAAVNNIERIRDATGTAPSKFTRSGGDRLREDQASLSGTGHGVLEDGFPRFVFNKGKNVNGFTIPKYFLAKENGEVMTNPYTDIPEIKDISVNRSVLVVYQDKTFDAVEKVNAIDLAYLVYVALGTIAHLPAHLQDETTADFTLWVNHWTAETGISSTQSANALAKLDEIHEEWVNSGKNAMVTRSVAFIYASDQHDVTSTSSYDVARNEWTVILKRKLNTSSVNDENLIGLLSGDKYTISFAMHDGGGGSASHDISMPYTLSNAAGGDIRAASVSNVDNANWNSLPFFDTQWVKRSVMFPSFRYSWLTSTSHPGAGMINVNNCSSCHNSANRSLINDVVIH
jgi:hypothetical protein